uniref:NADH dehydrogenase [ubiquinone] 1 beta subcomplex subunit 11, mitochondrial n=1 Tax=Fagus sylvatica TaxID=28930 RepID=A0A2N9GJC5_FAGSY
MAPPTAMSSASSMIRQRLLPSMRTRGGAATTGSSRWSSSGHEERPKGYLFNRTPEAPGQSRKWEDWELPCYITSFLTIVILGVGLNAKPDLTIETWAHQKALERLQIESLSSPSASSDSE